MQPKHTPLPRVLGPWITTAIVVGTVIGSGVFVKGRTVTDNATYTGLAMAAWVLGGVLALLGALALAEVAVLFPRAGGNYVFLREAYGRPMGFLWGWVEFWIIRSASIAALATIFTSSLHDALRLSLYPNQPEAVVFDFWQRQLITVLVIAGLATVNARGTRLGGGLQFVVTLVKVASLLFIIVLPFVVYAVVSEPKFPPKTENLAPGWPGSFSDIKWAGFGAALIGVLWAYHGWMNIAPVAEEVKNPQRNIPLSVLLGVLILIGLYCGAQLAYYLVVPRADIVAKDANHELKASPIATEFISDLIGPVGAIVASVILMTSVFGSLNGNLLVGPRLLYAMGHDRLAPAKLAEVHPRYKTPLAATVVLAGWSCFLVVALNTLHQSDLTWFDTDKTGADGKRVKALPFDVLTNFAVFGSVTFETLAVASIFVFRWLIPVTPENRPYRCWGYPVVPALYVAIMGAVLVTFFATPQQRTEAFVGIAFIALGAAVYALVFRGRTP
jgi:APA family basic amino acid/polyamine antiporter